MNQPAPLILPPSAALPPDSCVVDVLNSSGNDRTICTGTGYQGEDRTVPDH